MNIDIKKVKRFIYKNHLVENPYTAYTKEQVDFLKSNYKTTSYKEMGNKINRSLDSVKEKCKRLGLKRSHNDRKRIQKKYTSKTWFKGDPPNTKYDGCITIRKDSKGNRYSWIRISKDKWKMLQVHNWEQKFGPVPADKIIVAKDHNQLNCDPDNWLLIDRKEHMDRNLGRRDLDDKYVIRMLANHDKNLQEIIKGYPDLIEVKRNQLKLKRVINGFN
ncbi:hypothetical protein ES705_38765 [subsurface metagenome]